MSEPCKHEREFAGTQQDTLTSFIKTSGALVKMTAERDPARAALAELRASLTPERRPRFQGHSDGFSSGVTLAADRLVTPWVEIPDEVLSDEAIDSLRARFFGEAKP